MSNPFKSPIREVAIQVDVSQILYIVKKNHIVLLFQAWQLTATWFNVPTKEKFRSYTCISINLFLDNKVPRPQIIKKEKPS